MSGHTLAWHPLLPCSVNPEVQADAGSVAQITPPHEDRIADSSVQIVSSQDEQIVPDSQQQAQLDAGRSKSRPVSTQIEPVDQHLTL